MNGLYKLIGNTILAASLSVTGPETDKAKLWHTKLGHVSERGLAELRRQGLLEKTQLRN